jgi:enoyl-CoA hydratase/carnithine racemase
VDDSYLALSGARIQAADLVHTGVATHYVPSKQLPDLESALVEASQKTGRAERGGGACRHPRGLSRNHSDRRLFGAKQTLETLDKMSPTSLKVTFEGLNHGAKCESIAEDLQMEFRMAKACVRPNADFYEGVRSVLVDRDHSPKWNPATL